MVLFTCVYMYVCVFKFFLHCYVEKLFNQVKRQNLQMLWFVQKSISKINTPQYFITTKRNKNNLQTT